MLSVRLEEFQLFKVLRSTIDNHRDSGLHLLINLSRKQQIQLFATLGDERWAINCLPRWATSQSPAETKPHNIKTI